MATTDQAGTEQCRALTGDGGRCSRPAQEDGFCYQHDESDPTIDEQEEADEETSEPGDEGGEGSADEGGEQSAGQGDEESADEESADEESADEESADEEPANEESANEESANEESANEGELSTEEGDRTVTEEDLGESDSTILGVRRTVEGTATGLIGHPLDSITEVTATEDGWRAIVEVVERSSVPDTQDILGQYEIDLSDDIEVQGYRRIDRYRRSDTDK